jgi:S-adenosyl methyltransferase/Berberine and berberine like
VTDSSSPSGQRADPPEIDASVPNSARIWNYWLGGKDNVLDIGTGLPTADNTHEVAQQVVPEAGVVYVDNDPVVLAHARALLTSTHGSPPTSTPTSTTPSGSWPRPPRPWTSPGPVFYATADAAAVLRGWRDLTATMPDELTTLANILVAPPVPFLPEAVHGQMVIGIIGVYAGSVEDGTRAAQPLRTLAEPIADLMGPMPYTTMQSLLDPLWTAGANNYFTGTMLGELTDEAIETLLAQHAAGRAPVHELHLHHGGGAMANAPAGGTAFAHRDAAYILNIIARSPDRKGFETHAGWARATHEAMDPWSTGGGYVNFTSEPGQDKVQASYPPTTYARLVAAKDRYDPTNLFQLNQHIRPSGGH